MKALKMDDTTLSFSADKLQRKAINMNPMQHPPVNVLCILRGFDDPKFRHKITPYRIEREDGRIYQIKQIRQCTRHRQGKTFQYQYMVSTKEGPYLEIWFDGHTLSWRLTEERGLDGITLEY